MIPANSLQILSLNITNNFFEHCNKKRYIIIIIFRFFAEYVL